MCYKYSRIFLKLNLNVGNIMWNVVSPTKHFMDLSNVMLAFMKLCIGLVCI